MDKYDILPTPGTALGRAFVTTWMSGGSETKKGSVMRDDKRAINATTQIAFEDNESIYIAQSSLGDDEVAVTVSGNRKADGMGGRPALSGTPPVLTTIMAGTMSTKTLRRLYRVLQVHFEKETT
jgi:hypothetical protein